MQIKQLGNIVFEREWDSRQQENVSSLTRSNSHAPFYKILRTFETWRIKTFFRILWTVSERLYFI